MSLIPKYSWNKSRLSFNRQSVKLSKRPWFQGLLLLACVAVAMLLANLPFTSEAYHRILTTNLQVHLFSNDGSINLLFPRDLTVEKFINDILMTLFFFTVGLEIRREIAHGALSSTKKAMMPIVAAFGGVVAPALIYTAVNHGTGASSGWGIPTATDIAFAVCILTVLGDKVPITMKVFLTALAIVDDLIAILVVAIFYGGGIKLGIFGIALIFIGITFLLRRLKEKRMAPYLILAVAVWVLFYYSGIHATMSGVVMAFLIPSEARFQKAQYYHKREHFIKMLDEYKDFVPDEDFPNGPQKHYLKQLSKVAKGTMDMTYRVEQALSPWVNFLIMPIFALANAGVVISDASYFNIFQFSPELGSVSMGIFLGLLLGKPIGITIASWLAIKGKIGEMPDGTTWPMFFAVACLGGIGFTMSIFVDTLSFSDQAPEVIEHLRDAGKIAVLLGSVGSGVLGSLLINLVAKLQKK